MTLNDTEINSWADISHVPHPDKEAGTFFAHDRETGEEVGMLSYYVAGTDELMFKDVKVNEAYRRRRVATALLRSLSSHYPTARINPGMRNEAGEAFMKHILANEADKVATNGMLHVPLKTMMHPAFFSPAMR